jgi:hypothetical protein
MIKQSLVGILVVAHTDVTAVDPSGGVVSAWSDLVAGR